jgi:putative ABC transport system substrate-binding protein
MRRREFIVLLGTTAAWPLAARAQQPARMRLIGVLVGNAESDGIAQSWLTVFRGALAKLGWTEGSNLRIELRWSAGDADRMRTFAKELVDLRPDAIFGVTTPVIGALARETKTIPIVFAGVSDPIGSGFAANFTHLGGNITGFTVNDPTLGGKWVELLKEIAPRTVHVALLFNPATTVPLQFFMPSIQAAASSLAIEVSAAPVHVNREAKRHRIAIVDIHKNWKRRRSIGFEPHREPLPIGHDCDQCADRAGLTTRPRSKTRGTAETITSKYRISNQPAFPVAREAH